MKNDKIKALLTFLFLFIGMVIFPYIPLELFHINLDNLTDSMKILYQFSCDIGYMLIVFMLYRADIINNFKEYVKDFKKIFKLSFSYYIIGFIIMVISNNIIAIFFSEATAQNEEAVRDLISLYPAYMLFSTAVYAPFIEEIIFRKNIYNCVLSFGKNKITKYLYIAISGLLFAALHVLGSADIALDYLYIIPYLGLGCAFAAVYYKTDNILSTIILHSLHNTVAIIIFFLVGA